MADKDALAATEAGGRAAHHDAPTMALHWVTALIVVTLFALAEVWGFVPHSSPLRHEMISLHISLGLTLAAVYLLRLAWRSTGARRLKPAVSGVQHVASRLVHLALYGLLAAQLVLGFLLRWSQAPIGFFGLFSIPSPISISKPTHHLVAGLHDDVAWIIIILAGGHAMMALTHHYLLRDRVLRRMLPATVTR